MSSSIPCSRKPGVLFVDDEVIILKTLSRLFRSEPVNVFTAGSAADALEVLQEESIQVVVSDQQMAGTTGVELLAQVRERRPDVIRIMLTGYTEMNVAVEAINHGEVYRLMTKPWNEDDMRATVRQAIDTHAMRGEILRLNRVTQKQNRVLEEMNRGLFSGAEGSRNNGIEPIPSRIIPLRYAYEGITVNQATENYFELARRKIDNAAQTLKKEKDFAITYSNEGLSETKSERLAVLLRGLTLLYALEAPTEPLAREKVRVLLETSLNGSMEELKSVEIRDEEVEHPSCASYYVNERANQLVLKQDIQRVDLSKDEEPNIFLAEKKYFGDKANPDYLQIQQLLSTSPQQGTKINEDIPATVQQDWKTTFLCRSVLAMLSILLLVATTFIVAKSNRKKR